MRISPIEACDRSLESEFLRGVEIGIAVVMRQRAKRTGKHQERCDELRGESSHCHLHESNGIAQRIVRISGLMLAPESAGVGQDRAGEDGDRMQSLLIGFSDPPADI
jgi:hypothetical protein